MFVYGFRFDPRVGQSQFNRVKAKIDYIFFFCLIVLCYLNLNLCMYVCMALKVWFQAVAGARTYGTDSPAITNQPR